MSDDELIELLKKALDSTGFYVHDKPNGHFFASDEYLGMELTPAEADVLRPITNPAATPGA